MSEFLSDVGRALAAWRSAPLLPAFSVCVALVAEATLRFDQFGSMPPTVLLLVSGTGVLVLLFTIGSVGTERVWYLRAFHHEAMQPSLLWTLSWKFLGRYSVLGLLVFWPLIALFVAVFLVMRPELGHGGRLPIWFYVGSYGLVVVADLALTFAAPALAYTTASASQALRIGLSMTRALWPASSVYVLLPPLALALVARANPEQLSLPFVLVSTGLSTLANLLLKGATGAFYLRHQQPGTLNPPWQFS